MSIVDGAELIAKAISANRESKYVEFKEQFDVLYEEGKEYPQHLFFSTHAWLLGHPLGIKAIREAIRYTQGFPYVWQATENEIAKWWLEQGYD